MKKMVAILAFSSAVAAFGGSVAASDYPPGGGASGAGGGTGGDPGGRGALSATGSDTSEVLQIAGGVLVVGAGLAGVAWYRRKPAPA